MLRKNRSDGSQFILGGVNRNDLGCLFVGSVAVRKTLGTLVGLTMGFILTPTQDNRSDPVPALRHRAELSAGMME